LDLGTSRQGRSSEEKWNIYSIGIAAKTFPGTEFKVTKKKIISKSVTHQVRWWWWWS